MVAHAMVESGFDPLAIHDNATNAAYRPRTIAEAQQSVIRNMQNNTAEVPVDTERPQQRDPCSDIPSWDLWAQQECREHQEDDKQ
jgi:hypothetical protein